MAPSIDEKITRRAAGYATGAIASGGTEQTEGVDIRPFSSGLVLTPSDLNTDGLTFKVSPTLDGTYNLVNGATATGATDNWIPIPADAMKGKFLKVVTDAATAGAVTLQFLFKS